MLFSYLIILGAVILLYPLFLYGKIFKISSVTRPSTITIVLSSLTIFFLFAYLASAILLHSRVFYIDSMTLVSVVFFFGAIFVAISTQFFYIMIADLENKIAERTKELTKAHSKAIKKERQIQKLKDKFLFIAAHELRTPVTAIKWSVEMLLESVTCKKCREEHGETLQILHTNADNLATLINDLLDTSRIESGTVKIEKKPFDLNKTLKVVVDSFSELVKKDNISLSFDISKQKLPKINSDEKRIKEVLTNLLSNAIKYNKPNGSVVISIKKAEGNALITIKDTGVGIQPAKINQLFSKFCRLEAAENSEVKGTGLGLFISKEIVSALGGKIWAESEGKDKGSTFSFSIPIS